MISLLDVPYTNGVYSHSPFLFTQHHFRFALCDMDNRARNARYDEQYFVFICLCAVYVYSDKWDGSTETDATHVNFVYFTYLFSWYSCNTAWFVNCGHYSGDDFIGPQLVNHPVYLTLFMLRFCTFFLFRLTLRRRIKSHLLFAGIIRSSPFSLR